MKRKKLLLPMALLLASGGVSQDRGTWRAASTSAQSITGQVAFGDETISINFANFPIANIRPLTTAEAVALFAEPNAGGSGHVYRVSISATQKFVRKNTLCGADETDWMITYIAGQTLQLAFFSGAKMPVISAEALATNTSLCGTFTYTR